MGTTVQAPPPRNIGQETRDTLQAEVDLAPQQYTASAKYQPMYTTLGLQNLQTALSGTGQQQGLLDILDSYFPRLQQAQQGATSAQRAGDIADVSKYGGQAREAYLSANPEAAKLLSGLTSQANQDLASNGQLDPATLRQVQQASRQAQAARGMGFGNADAFAEAMNVGVQAEQRRRQQQAFASSVLGLNQGYTGDPFQQILGRPSSAVATGGGFLGSANQAIGTQSSFNPMNSYASDLYGQNYKGALDVAGANASAGNALTGGILGMFGSAAGGLLGNRGLFR